MWCWWLTVPSFFKPLLDFLLYSFYQSFCCFVALKYLQCSQYLTKFNDYASKIYDFIINIYTSNSVFSAEKWRSIAHSNFYRNTKDILQHWKVCFFDGLLFCNKSALQLRHPWNALNRITGGLEKKKWEMDVSFLQNY